MDASTSAGGAERAVRIACENKKRAITSGVTTQYEAVVHNDGTKDDVYELKVGFEYGSREGDEPPEWNIRLLELDEDARVRPTAIPKGGLVRELAIHAGRTKNVVVNITSPRGVRYGDRVDLKLAVTSKSDPAIHDSCLATTTAKQAVLVVKTQIGHEKVVADLLSGKARSKGTQGVFAILSPNPVRGYVFVEAMTGETVQNLIKGMQKVRGLIREEVQELAEDGRQKLVERFRATSIDDKCRKCQSEVRASDDKCPVCGEALDLESKRDKGIAHYLTPKPLVAGMVEGDIVELISGPFRGEKARVKQIDEAREEITVELFEAMVPIPVTVRGDSVRIIEKDKG